MTKITSSFQRIPLTDKDTISGAILSSIHTAIIQNHRVDIAEQKLNLVFDPQNVVDFAQQNAYLQGQLDILQMLLDASETAQQLVLQQAASQSQSKHQ